MGNPIPPIFNIRYLHPFHSSTQRKENVMSKRIVSFTACCIFFLVFCLSGCSHTSETTENTHPVETTDTTQTLTTETPETPETTYDSSEIVTSVPQRNYYKTLIHNGDEYTFYIYENEINIYYNSSQFFFFNQTG